MSVELRPMGVHCNIACQYCYQNPIRDAGNVSVTYDMALMKRGITAEGGPFTIFGGEPLLMPMPDLEELFRWGFEAYGANAIQTNGTLVTDAHLDLFHRWNVQVGVSVDGPEALNDVRWVANLTKTREATDRTHDAIARLCIAGLPPSIIITLHRVNGAASAFAAMTDWILHLERLGVTTVRLHMLEVDGQDIAAKYQIPEAEQIACFRRFHRLQRDHLTTLSFDIFDEVRGQLMAHDAQNGCVWHACDPLTTRAVRGVEGQGQRSNCGRTNKDGIEYVKSATEGFERYIALHQTPVAHNGCGGCRFFLACKGQCPGTSEDGDWRNRSEGCGLWYALLEDAEQALIAEDRTPISRHPHRHTLEANLLRHWKQGRNPTLEYLASDTAEAPSDDTDWRFARLSWTSDRAQAVWQPIMRDLRRELVALRRAAVAQGLYPKGTETIPIQLFRQVSDALEAQGLAVVETQMLVSSERHLCVDDTAADPLRVRVTYAVSDAPADTQTLETSLHWLDRLVPLAQPDATPTLALDWTLNPFWTLLGLDLLPGPEHGEPPLERQSAMQQLARDRGMGRSLDHLSEILSWPVEWSILHGIGQIQTPVMRIIHDIAPTPDKRVLRWAGDLLPLEAAQSHGFAFRQPKRRRITHSTTYLRGLREIGQPGDTPA